MRRHLPLRIACLLTAVLSACGDPECVTGEEDGCVIASPCGELRSACEGGLARVTIIEPGDTLPNGADALASPGDFLLSNDRVRVVIDGLGHPHHLAASGGSIVDLTRVGDDVDALVQIAQATSLRPGETVVYDRYRIFEGDGFAALQVRGHLEADEGARVSTRYELRACEAGIRVRTELTQRGTESRIAALGDAFFWGGHGHQPFVPAPNVGFDHGESDEDVRVIEAPFVATVAPNESAPALGAVACGVRALVGFHREEISFVGLPSQEVSAGEKLVFERFIIVGDGPSVANVADIALDVRSEMFGEASVLATGVVTAVGGGRLSDETRATVIVRDSTSSTPWTQITAEVDGTFRARVPANGEYVFEAQSFGRAASSVSASIGTENIDVGTLETGALGTVRLEVTLDGEPATAFVVLEPHDDAGRAALSGRRFGQSPTCAPLLGPPHGGSPACNRVVVREGSAEVAAPTGTYFATASVGPFDTIARTRVDVVAGAIADVRLALTRLPLERDSYLGIDLHTHGPSSFDSSVDEESLVFAALAADLDVLAVTDTDVVGAFDAAVAAAGATGRLLLLPSVEAAALVPFEVVAGQSPETSGRYGFVPLARVDTGPWRGAPLDEGTLPGALFTRTAAAGFSATDGLIEMLHSYDEPFLGRERSFARAIGLDARRPLIGASAPLGNAAFGATPPGARFSNAEVDLIEVVAGSALTQYPAYRALYHYLLSENLIRAGTANAGARGIGDTLPGSPRTLVPRSLVSGPTVAQLALGLSEGASIGTNGPIVEISLVDAGGASRRPSVSPVVPGADPTLHVRVSAAPWVPVDEVRIVVNGVLATRLTVELSQPLDPFGAEGAVRYEGDVPIAAALPVEFGDAWVVVEAGTALVAAGDLDCDGIPDTGDNDGNGTIDSRDVGVRAGPSTASPEVGAIADVCLASAGPLRAPRVVNDVADRHHIFAAVTTNAMTLGFSSPIFLDLDGGGYGGAPRGVTPP